MSEKQKRKKVSATIRRLDSEVWSGRTREGRGEAGSDSHLRLAVPCHDNVGNGITHRVTPC
jgi:hypothetical protein